MQFSVTQVIQISSPTVGVHDLGILPSILSNKYTIVFEKVLESILPTLRSVENPLVVYDQNTDQQLLDVAQ